MRGQWEQVEHMADLALRIHGQGPRELFVNAAHAMFSQIDPRGAKLGTAPVERRVRVQGIDPDSLLVNWLNELLYLYETHREVYSKFEIRRLHCVPMTYGTARRDAPRRVDTEAPAITGIGSADTLRPMGTQDDPVLDAEWHEGRARAPNGRPEVPGHRLPCEVSATIRGASSSEAQQIIKAATFHGLRIRCGRQGCVATVVFDV